MAAGAWSAALSSTCSTTTSSPSLWGFSHRRKPPDPLLALQSEEGQQRGLGARSAGGEAADGAPRALRHSDDRWPSPLLAGESTSCDRDQDPRAGGAVG